MDSDSLMQADVDQPSREDWRDVMVLLLTRPSSSIPPSGCTGSTRSTPSIAVSGRC